MATNVALKRPSDTAPLIQRRIERLRKYLGDDGFALETEA